MTTPLESLQSRILNAQPDQLREIERSSIPNCVGLSDAEREQLKTQISQRHARLNAEAVGEQKARWI